MSTTRLMYPTEANYGILGSLTTSVVYKWDWDKKTVDIIAVFCRSLSNENLLAKIPKKVIDDFEVEIIEAIES